MVTVTHPHHPLYKQRVEVIRVRRGPDPDLVIRLPDGLHAAIAASCTDYLGDAPLEPSAGPPPLLALDGLCQIVQFIDQLRQQCFSTPRNEGARSGTDDQSHSAQAEPRSTS